MIHLTVQQLSASLDGALTGPSLELVVRHLAACHDCRDRQARLAKHDDALRRLMGQEPTDIFLDDLTRRAEALATAIARGMPAPIMVTSVPLLHEEDPFAPVEPPPLPPRPELGKSGQIAKDAGWGRIGVKPTAPAQVPHSDPEEAQRMLEALAGGNSDDFTELTAEGLQDHAQVDGPVFDLPAWIKDQSGAMPSPQGARDVREVDRSREDLDPHAPGMTREAVNEMFRRDEVPGRPGSEHGPLAPESHDYEEPVGEHVPPAHAPYAPRGWTGDAARHEHAAPAHPEAAEYAPPGRDAGYAPAEAAAYAPAGWHHEPAPPADPNASAWRPGAFPPGARDPGAYPQPPVAQFGDHGPGAYRTNSPGAGRAPGMDPVALLAIASVGALLLMLLVLQLVPAGPRAPARGGSHGLTGGKSPQQEILRQGEQAPAPVGAKPHVRTAETPPPVEEVVPSPVMPVPTDATDHNAPGSATQAAGTPTPAQQPEAATVTASTTQAPAQAAHPATVPATAHAATSTPAAAGEDAEWPLLCGQVADDAGQPVVNARVSMAEISFATRTDSRGRFCVSAPAGTHALYVESSGFTPQRVPVTISSSSMDVRIRLQPAR